MKDLILMLDTETANTLVTENGKLDMTCVLPYDLGLAVTDRSGYIYETDSMVNRDIFVDEAELMKSAYYAKKIPIYINDIQTGTRRIVTTYEMRKRVIELIDKYHIKHVCAHNARFDINALNNIQRWTTKSKYRYFFPVSIEIWDTMKMATDTICKQPTYKKFCVKNGYMTKNNQVRKTAEILYRYITREHEFEEAHTGLEDVLIETAIMAHCFKQHKKMRKILFESPIAKSAKA